MKIEVETVPLAKAHCEYETPTENRCRNSAKLQVTIHHDEEVDEQYGYCTQHGKGILMGLVMRL